MSRKIVGVSIVNLTEFLGSKVISLFTWGTIAGLILFGVELTFAYSLQSFLLVLGVASPAGIKIPSWIPQNGLVQVLIFVFCVALIRGLLQGVQLYLQGRAPEQFKYLQRSRLLNWSFHGKAVSTSQVSTLFTERCNLAGNTIMYLQQFSVQGTASIFILGALIYMAPLITLLALLFLLITVLPIKYSGRKVALAGGGLAHEWDKTNNRLLMSIKNLLFLKIYGMQFKEEKLTQDSLSKYLGHLKTYYVQSGFIFAFPQIFGVLLICIISYTAKTYNQLSMGVLVSYFYLFVRFLQNTAQISSAASNFIFQKPQLSALYNWWLQNSKTSFVESDTTLITSTAARPTQPYGWHLNKVNFSYNSDQPLIKDFDLHVPPGGTAVFVGPSGAGKSTIINLLLGQLTPQSGLIEVEVSGKKESMSKIKNQVLSNIGYVGAESFLVDGTIYDNIVYGLSFKPTDEDINQALQQSECQFISELSDKLNHHINDQGEGLSAGQKQRLCLMRALLRNPLTLILDEATANLDSETEQRLVATLKILKGKMTIIAVTHRKELLQIADQQIRI